jgi:hypothetical protein
LKIKKSIDGSFHSFQMLEGVLCGARPFPVLGSFFLDETVGD